MPSEIASAGEHDRSLFARIVTVQEYGSDRSEAIHDSLTILGQKPVDKTVLVGVDEFVAAESKTGEGATKILDSFAEVGSAWPYYVSNPDPKANPVVRANRLVPYYANVLVLAYNTSLVNADWKCNAPFNWTEILKTAKTPGWVPPSLPTVKQPQNEDEVWNAFIDEWFAKPLLKRPRLGEQRSLTYWPFEVGAWSMETLACILLDAIVSGSNGKVKENDLAGAALYDPGKVAAQDSERGDALLDFIAGLGTDKCESLRSDLTSLAYLFYYSWRHWALDLSRAQAQRIERSLANKLVPNAVVYVCWYSQLRELIDEYPQLGSVLKVRALPGSGFKGDWFMGVVKGSVSLSLGKVVLDTLCAEDEDRKRFVRGVGLPVRSSYVENPSANFLAWPRADQIRLIELIDIHQRALSRSRIKGYDRLRGMLGTFGRQIAFSPAAEAMPADDAVDDCIERLPKIVEFLGLNPKTRS